MSEGIQSVSIVLTTEAENEAALTRVEAFFDLPEEPDPDSPEGKEFVALIDAIEAYEAFHYPIDPPEPHEMLRYVMDTKGVSIEDLADIAAPAVLVDVLAGKVPISGDLAEALALRFSIGVGVFKR